MGRKGEVMQEAQNERNVWEKHHNDRAGKIVITLPRARNHEGGTWRRLHSLKHNVIGLWAG